NKYEGTPLVANYKIDDDGIEAENVILVKDGYLKNLLSDRVPTKRVRESNGHKRGGSPILSNIIFEGSDDEKVKSISEMRERMMELCKARELPYGLIIKRVMNINVFITGVYPAFYGDLDMQFGNSDITLLEVYKLYPDGREEPVRGARAAGFSEQSFKDIIAVNGKKYVHNYLAPAVVSSFISQGDPYVACSIVTPGLLFEDAEIRMIDEDFRKPPLISKPAVNN
ncbi:MAG: metallopeptidase TldD-related protein, partial [Candidatus Kapaibacterium sp.]